ncbi:DALR anticodon-binding domain-containing protein 3-like [Saccostrea echinata]|uniref:DALR anticodon-binding domain-containing protein 3-like n=1 Tax=Saccostrea echinata TaxID=191078 RepID=UPI002A7F0A33|nr:DALR anticodon-binding domain-containing protein 3-like [Saccostrea echinata]
MEVCRQQSRHMSSESVLDDILEVVSKNCAALDRDPSKLVVQRRQKKLQDGDFCIPKGCFQMNGEEFAHLRERLLEESRPWTCPVREVKSDTYNSMLISLNRPTTLKSVISSLLNSEVSQDSNSIDDRESNELKGDKSVPAVNETHKIKRRTCEKTVLVNAPDCSDCQSLEQLRGLVLTQHILQLLKINGLRGKLATQPVTENSKRWFELLNFDCGFLEEQEEICDVKHILDVARGSEYRLQTKGQENKLVESETTSNHEPSVNTSECVVLNAEDFLASKTTEDGDFDKNLGKIHLMDENGHTDTLIEISHLQKCKEKMDQCACVLHIIPDRKNFQQQKIHLGWQILTKDAPRQIHQMYGSVTERKSKESQKMDSQTFYNLRFDQMKEASVMKYGERVKGAGWNKTIENLTMASVKFELLHNVPRNTVKLDLSEGNEFGGGIDNRAGAFVMYNCARLATLFKHFHKAVEEGVYPPLPSIDSIDFGLLREEDEWSLFFNYIFPYPDLLRTTVSDLFPSNDGIYAKLGTHKISNFLIGLSRSLSSYYSHVHVLVENRPNLMPTMFARLYLLKAIHYILKDGLHLMGISPPTQL